MDDLTFFIIFIVIFIVIVALLWLFAGGGDHKFEGLSFLDPPVAQSNSGESDSEESIYDSVEVNDSEKVDEVKKVDDEDSCILYDDVVSTEKLSKTEDICEIIHIPSTIVKFPSYAIDYYENFVLLNKNDGTSGKHMEKRTAAESRGEKLCRNILEKFYNKPFPTARPDFLINPETSRNLELDCYNAELSIALEYNGAQHYVFPNKFHKTQEEFDDQKARDKHKIDVCARAGIYLITVPYDIPHAKLAKFIEYLIPENVAYRQQHGIEGKYEDEFWDEKEPNMPQNGYI